VKLLLDTHALLWAIDEPVKLSADAAANLHDPTNDLMVSAATVWEVAIKFGIKKLVLPQPYGVWMNQAIVDLKARLLAITVAYAECQSSLPDHHRDPFDRLLIAQALVEAVPIVSADTALDPYGVNRLW
jgi:PIN domain nuclease of toxin-antitoxin system